MIRRIITGSFFAFFAAVFLFTQHADAARFCTGSLPGSKTETQCYDGGEDGFFSQFLVIEQGTKVIFQNDSAEDLIIASNPHPTHELLSGLDSGVISPHKSWSYTFEKRGRWGYHNHFKPDQDAEVLVVGKKIDDIFSAQIPPSQANQTLSKTAVEKMPKLPKPSKKEGMKRVIVAGKAEITIRARKLEENIRALHYYASQSSLDQREPLQQLEQSAKQDLDRVRAIGKKIDQSKNASEVSSALNELLSLRILSQRVGFFDLQKNSVLLKSTLESYEDITLQLEPTLQWQESDEQKEELVDRLADTKETITRLQDELDELPDVAQSSIRTVYAKMVKDTNAVGKTLRSLITGIKNLNTQQNSSKGFEDLTSGRACEQSRASSYQQFDVICYKDEPIDFWNYGRVGKKIYFYNASSHDLWLASDPHPSHTSYTEFNSGKAIVPGSYFEFVFTKAGKYTYHNHLKPERTMKLKIGSSDTIEIEAEDMAKMQPKFGLPLNK